MAIIKNVELWWTKVDPKNPVKNADPTKPAQWEVQLRTTDKETAMHWAKNNVRFKPLRRKLKDEAGEFILDDMGEVKQEIVKNDAGLPYFAVTLRKKVTKANGEASEPVTLVGGDLSVINPKSVGNGSLANVRVFQYEYTFQGKEGIASMLMGIQVTKLLEYASQSSEDQFEVSEMEVVSANSNQNLNNDDIEDDEIPF